MQTFFPRLHGVMALAGLALLFLPLGLAQQSKPYKVTIVEDKPLVAESFLPIDPNLRISFNYNQNMTYTVVAEGKQLAQSAGTMFMIDGQIRSPQTAEKVQKLPAGPFSRKRHGTECVWQQGDIRVTNVVEVVPGKPPQPKPGAPIARRMDTLLVKYIIENTGNVPHRVGVRPAFRAWLVGNNAPKFAAPTYPNQILDGVVLAGKLLPDYVENLERDSLEDPGFKAIFSVKLGNKMEEPSKIVLTRMGLIRNDIWDVMADPGGFTGLVLFWEPREIPPHGKREVAFGYGQGIACTNEGRVSADFGGSFEPGKRFTITAYVDGPIDGQSLTLQLPKGIERIDGRATQAVPLSEDYSNSVVMWHCRVREVGTHTIAIRSSSGVTNTWKIAVAPPE